MFIDIDCFQLKVYASGLFTTLSLRYFGLLTEHPGLNKSLAEIIRFVTTTYFHITSDFRSVRNAAVCGQKTVSPSILM